MNRPLSVIRAYWDTVLVLEENAVWFPAIYICFEIQKEDTTMQGKTTHKGVFESWIVALERYGKNPDTATKRIHMFMRNEFPNRRTNWKKWANLVRQRYNRGAFVAGVKPRKPLALFKEAA